MNTFTDALGLVYGADLSIEDADALLAEVDEKAKDIMGKAYAEFNSFLNEKGLRNSMGVLAPKDDAKVLYHITDIEWDLDDEDVTESDSNLPTSVDAQNIDDTVAEYLSNTYHYLVKSYKVSIEIIDESKNNDK